MNTTINVIELFGETDMHVNSFILFSESIKRETTNKKRIKKAEDLFVKLAKENGASFEEVLYSIESGYYERGDYKLFLIWNEN